MVSVRLKDISFRYPVFEAAGRSLKISLMQQFSGLGSRRVTEVQALEDVSLELSDDDRVGLIGGNGAGKTTLLKVIAGVLHPQSGGVKIHGKVVSLISRGIGMHDELSGWRNIEVPMRLMGATEAEIRKAREDIPEWSGLGEFIHLPLRTYSSGMRARLLFAICTAVRGDILAMDEWLSAGDADFIERAQQRLNELVETTRIVVLSSHNLEIIRRTCNKVCWMERGKIVMSGPTEVVLSAYNGAGRGAVLALPVKPIKSPESGPRRGL